MAQLPDRIRAFVAIRMSNQVEEAVGHFLDKLRQLDDRVRWVRRANLHVTLRFLGNEATPIQLGALAVELAQIATAAEPFQLHARGIGGFPSLARPRVVWAGLSGANLIGLAASVETAAVKAGFGSADRPYSPHLTIGRVREAKGIGPLRAVLEAARD